MEVRNAIRLHVSTGRFYIVYCRHPRDAIGYSSPKSSPGLELHNGCEHNYNAMASYSLARLSHFPY